MLTFTGSPSQVAGAGGPGNYANSVLNPVTSQSYNGSSNSNTQGASWSGDSSYLIGAVYAGVNNSSVTVGANNDTIGYTSISNGNFNNYTPKTCLKFVEAVKNLINNSPHKTQDLLANLVDELYERFANSGNEFGSGGFNMEFQDFGGSPNQARHYIGGLYAGFTLGSSVGLAAANAREVSFTYQRIPGIPYVVIPIPLPPNASQRADRALNAVSTAHGGALADGTLKPSDLSSTIRKEVCRD